MDMRDTRAELTAEGPINSKVIYDVAADLCAKNREEWARLVWEPYGHIELIAIMKILVALLFDQSTEPSRIL